MAIIKCSECSGRVSTEATACPHCGVPAAKQKGGKKNSSVGASIIGLAICWFAVNAAITGGRDGEAKDYAPQAPKREHLGSLQPAPASVPVTPEKPLAGNSNLSIGKELVVSNVADTGKRSTAAQPGASPVRPSISPGVSPTHLSQLLRDAGLTEGTMWKQSRLDSSWYATQRRTFGGNEVSCLLESPNSDTVETVELEAEFYVLTQHHSAMMEQFRKAAVVLCPDAPAELIAAIGSQGSWSGSGWLLQKHPHASGGGYDYRLARRLR
jgi:hypothetical protein